MKSLTVKTRKPKEVVDITDEVAALAGESGVENGLCNLFLRHTSAALTAADLDPGTDLDMLDAFREMVPKLAYRHPHDPSHVPDHILSAAIGVSLTLPVRGGKLALGEWQRVVVIEFNGPREREIVASFVVTSA